MVIRSPKSSSMRLTSLRKSCFTDRNELLNKIRNWANHCRRGQDGQGERYFPGRHFQSSIENVVADKLQFSFGADLKENGNSERSSPASATT